MKINLNITYNGSEKSLGASLPLFWCWQISDDDLLFVHVPIDGKCITCANISVLGFQAIRFLMVDEWAGIQIFIQHSSKFS